jgi:hypothetical protein
MSDIPGSVELSEEARERYERIDSHNLPNAAVRRFLDDRDLPVPESDDNFKRELAQELTGENVDELVRQHKYAGQQTLNYFVVTGINEHNSEEIVQNVESEFPEKDDVEGIANEPYLADKEEWDSRLYLTFGFFTGTGGVDPATGKRKTELTTDRCVAIVRENTSLVEVRTSEPRIAETVVNDIAQALGNYKDSSKYRPDFGQGFQEDFSKLVERYTNLKVRVENREGTTVDTISFTSREGESGKRKDAREDERVARELEEKGGEITIGYVHLEEGFRFQINRKQAKISIRKHEREENINQITQIIDDVLRQAGGYTQRTFGGLEDVPE